jgi:TOMM system kinase/cyclase fusion protein
MFEGRYEILAKLGEGGFGTVHKARQLTTGQPVAVKILRLPEPAGEANREKRIARFLREMQLCAQLHHPNLVQLVDSGRTERGLLYGVFAFAPGDNLADLLAKEGALAPAEAKHLMLQVLDALACAHADGVVHRDLKPRNIMVIPTGARRNALVLDFGIGAITDEAGTPEATRLTMTNETLGTPGYAAPEQWRGLEPTPRADLFAWGLVLLECLTGAPVYGGGSAADLVYQQLGPEPVPIPPALQRHPLGDLLRAATRKDLAARDVTAKGLLAALEACDLRGLSRGALRVGGEASMVATEALSAPGAATASTLDGERRQVTALCCHLSGDPSVPTSGARAGDEDDAILRAGLALSAEVARRHGGHVAATLGDELMVYFGYPRAEEDDARRAARAALAILGALEAAGRGLEARVGIHTGLVVARDHDDTALASGSTPRLASQIARRAAPGAILVTVEAHRLLRSTFVLDAEGKQQLDGTDTAIKLYRLGHGEPTTGPTPEGTQTPLVGRAQEMELLLDRWRRTRAGGGQCGLITGEPGIGKSRLSRELRDRLVNEAHTFVEGRCSPDTRNNALYPVIELLGRALGLDREASTDAKVARLEAQLTRHGLVAAEAMPLFLPLFSLPLGAAWAPLEVSPQKQKELTLNAILALLFAMAEERPVLLVVEDLHWADPTTLELLGLLVREAPSASMCVLLTARPEFSPAFSTMGVLQLQLNRLERAQIEAMVGDLVGGKALPPAVLEQVANRTDGVPLFVEELTRMMVESGALVEREDRYDLTGALSDVEIPGTLRGLLTARLDRLGRAKETAQLAAALGREFSVELLTAVSRLGGALLQEDLDRLMAAGLVLRKRRRKDPECVFKHALVRDAAYEGLSPIARRSVHNTIAQALLDAFPDRIASRPDLLAQHLSLAGRPREAVSYWVEAGTRGANTSAYHEATEQLTAALRDLEAQGESIERNLLEYEIRSLMGVCLSATQGYASDQIEANYRRISELGGHLGPIETPELRNKRFMNARGVWLFHLVRSELGIAHEVLREMSELAGETPLRTEVQVAKGNTYGWEGEFAAARACFRAADESLSEGMIGEQYLWVTHSSLSAGPTTHAWIAALTGDVQGAFELRDRCVRYAASLSDAHAKAFILAYMTQLAYYLRDEPLLRVHAEQTIALSREHGIPNWLATGQMYRAWSRALRGDVEGGMQELRSALMLWDYLHVTLNGPLRAGLLAELQALGGELEPAIASISAGIELAVRTNELNFVVELRRLRATWMRQVGAATSEVEAELRAALELADVQGTHLLGLRTSCSLARLLSDCGRREEARGLLSRATERFRGGPTFPDLEAARDLLGALT